MSPKTLRGSNLALTRHSPQPVWVSAAFCRETWVDRAISVTQLGRIDCVTCHLSVLATTMMAVSTTSNDAVPLQIPIAA
jgi:hypothetical protein